MYITVIKTVECFGTKLECRTGCYWLGDRTPYQQESLRWHNPKARSAASLTNTRDSRKTWVAQKHQNPGRANGKTKRQKKHLKIPNAKGWLMEDIWRHGHIDRSRFVHLAHALPGLCFFRWSFGAVALKGKMGLSPKCRHPPG